LAQGAEKPPFLKQHFWKSGFLPLFLGAETRTNHVKKKSSKLFYLFFQSAGKQKKHNEIELFFSSVPWRFSRRGVAKTAAAIQKTIFTIEKKFGQRGA
jgi:hypothetical protein